MMNLDDEKEHQICAITNEKGPDFVSEFQDVFSAKEFNQLPQHQPWDHAIEFTEGFKASDCKIYQLSEPEQEELQKFINENLSTDCI
jgi:hypothetical protein